MTDRDLAKRLVEAAAWQMKLPDAREQDLAQFEAWRLDPANAKAWEQLSRPWTLIGEHANDQRMVALRQAALSDAKKTSARLNTRKPYWGRIAAAFLLVGVLGAGVVHWLRMPADYQTGFGERRIIMLDDGSRVSLDSDSEVTVRFGRTARELELLRGQARFDVAHDVERPFSVQAGDQKVIATGTAFNIDMTQPKVLVTLIEGHVVVIDHNHARTSPQAPERSEPVSTELHAGQQLAAISDHSPIVTTTDLQQVTSWTTGQLIFDDQTLAEVVARVNHYTRQKIQLDSKAASMRISGSFNAGDSQGFLEIVTRYLPLKQSIDANGDIVLTSRHSASR